jgi:hypothetical protein
MQNCKSERQVIKRSRLGEAHYEGEGPHWTVVASNKNNNKKKKKKKKRRRRRRKKKYACFGTGLV